MKFRTFLAGLAAALILTGCGAGTSHTLRKELPSERRAESSFYAMDTHITATAYGKSRDKALRLAEDRIRELEKRLSVTDPASDIYRLNARETQYVGHDAELMLWSALQMYEKTDGLFDPTIYPLVRAWGFTTDEHRVPPAEEISALLPHDNASRIKYEYTGSSVAADIANVLKDGEAKGTLVILPDGAELDLGGIAKGFAGEDVARQFEGLNVTGALVNLGGNVQTYGEKPDKSPWRIGLQSPWDTTKYLGVLDVPGGPHAMTAVVTSGSYQRYFIDENGIKRHHIIDPETGYPAESDLASATVVGPSGTECDAFATALFIMGEDGAAEYWRTHWAGSAFGIILVTEDGRIRISEDLADRFKPSEEDPLPLEVIHR